MELGQSRLTVMRGTETDERGGESDVGVPIYRHMPAALAETSKSVFDPASSTRRTIRTVMCVLPGWADVLISDTLMDEATGNYFMIQSAERQPSLIGAPPSLILTLRMRSGVSVRSDG